jgi:alkylation response protein AidB-like acyl-CoA dehydrogenase
MAMDLEFTSDQEALRETVQAVLAKECPIGVVRALVEKRWEDPTATTDEATALWSTMVELGWPALTIPEDDGGIGLGPIEAAAVAEELGRSMAPTPLLPVLSQLVPALVEIGTPAQRAEWLGAVAGGECTGALALTEATGSFDPAKVTATLTPSGDGYLLTADKRAVMEGDVVDVFVVVARIAGTNGDDGITAVLLPRAAATSVDVIAGVDRSRGYANVRFDKVTVSADAVLGGADAVGTSVDGVRRVIEHATVGVAAEMVGTAQTIFDIALQYAKERHQFGVPIGSFQSMKHKFADLTILLERARATAYFAALTLAEDDPRRALAVAMAKAAAGDAQASMAKQGIQILGGIGFTWEHDMHLYVRRLTSDSVVFGTASKQRSRVADLLGV